MTLVLLLVASIAYALGGVLMKLSDGLGVSDIFVLGVEAVVTVLLSAVYLREPYSASRVATIVVVVAGVACLRAT